MNMLAFTNLYLFRVKPQYSKWDFFKIVQCFFSSCDFFGTRNFLLFCKVAIMRQEEKPPSIYDLLSRQNLNKSLRHLFIRLFLCVSENEVFCTGNESLPNNFQSCLPIVAFIFLAWKNTPWKSLFSGMYFLILEKSISLPWFIDLCVPKRFTLDCPCCKTFSVLSAPPIMSPNHESPDFAEAPIKCNENYEYFS